MGVSLKIAGLAVGLLAATAWTNAASAVPTNLAIGGTASQSEPSFANAGLAIDGNTDGVFANGSVSETGFGNSPFWQVNLGSLQTVGDVVIWNRTDNESYHLHDFFVAVYNSVTNTEVYQFFSTPPNPSIDVNFLIPAVGDIVKVQLADLGSARVLPLAEVQVYAPGVLNALDVPEPASIALLVSGVIGGMAAARRRRAASNAAV